MDKLTELLQQRARLVQEGREILDAAEGENRALNAEEREKYDRIMADVDSIGARAEDLSKQAELERQLAGGNSLPFDPRQTDDPGNSAEQRAEEYERVFWRYVREGIGELDLDARKLLRTGFVDERDQSKGTPAAGGFTVPVGFHKQLQEHQVQVGVMRQLATMIQTGGGEDLQIPKTTAHGAASIVGEAGAITATDETFGQVTLQAFKYVRLIKVSIELLQDTAVDLLGYLSRELGRSVGAAQNTHFANGSGSGQPQGVVGASAQGKVGQTGQTTSIILDDIFDLFFSVSAPYRREAAWLTSDAMMKVLRKLKDSDGRPLWEPSLRAGEPDTLLGKPIHSDPDVPAPAANAKSLIFGAVREYWVRDAGSFQVRRLDERYADNLQVGFLAWHRSDGDLIDTTGAVKHYQHSAT